MSDIRVWDDPILKQVCSAVEKTEDVAELVSQLKKVLWATPDGVGLAAPQIGETKRVFVTRMRPLADIEVFINPEIVEKNNTTASAVEGCLSYPNIYTNITRNTKIKLKWQTEDGSIKEEWQSGREAIISQHELDHLDGICLVGDYWRDSNKHVKQSYRASVEQVAVPVQNNI